MKRYAAMPTTVGLLAAMLCAVTFSPPAATAQELVLVENGAAQAPIVLFEDAPPRTREAAEELATYIEKVSGARPDLVEGEPDPAPDRAIWVGYQPKLDELFPDVRFEFEHPEEIVIAANADHLVIAGRDRWREGRMTSPDRKGDPLEGVQMEYGTVNAIYTFIEDYLEVRWLWPGELGEDIIEKDTIRFEPFQYRYHPMMRERSGLLRFSALSYGSGYGHSHDWARRQRLQFDSLDTQGGHGFTDWWDRFHETHPEYFALQPDGTRSGFPSPDNAKLCQSNPAVWDQWLQDVETQLEEDPNRVVFNAAPNDSWLSGHCVCENCEAWDHPDGEMRNFRWDGESGRHVALSDRHVTFANTLGRMLKERYPDKEYYVMMTSYGHSRPLPIEAAPDDNVIISSVANFMLRHDNTDRGSPNDTPHREQLRGWGELARHVVWRPNTGSPAGWRQAMPDIHLTQAIKDYQLLTEIDCRGVIVDTVWEHWATQGPQYYLMGQLTWNPAQDGHAVLEDYYQRGFGPGAEQVKEYWSLLEDARNTYRTTDTSYSEVYDEAMLDRAAGLLREAMAAAEDGPEKYRQRIAFLRAGLEFTGIAVENRELLRRYQESEQSDTAAAQQVRDNFERIQAIAEEHPHSINWGPLRPQTGRMPHPDH